MKSPWWFTLKIKDVLTIDPQRSILGLVLLTDLINNMDDKEKVSTSGRHRPERHFKYAGGQA